MLFLRPFLCSAVVICACVLGRSVSPKALHLGIPRKRHGKYDGNILTALSRHLGGGAYFEGRQLQYEIRSSNIFGVKLSSVTARLPWDPVSSSSPPDLWIGRPSKHFILEILSRTIANSKSFLSRTIANASIANHREPSRTRPTKKGRLSKYEKQLRKP